MFVVRCVYRCLCFNVAELEMHGHRYTEATRKLAKITQRAGV